MTKTKNRQGLVLTGLAGILAATLVSAGEFLLHEAVDNNLCMQSTLFDPHATQFFYFTLYGTDGYLMDGNTVINSRDMVSNPDGTYTVSINCSDAAINNISAPADIETIGYAWRVYGASEEVENRSWDPIDSMQVVTGANIIKR